MSVHLPGPRWLFVAGSCAALLVVAGCQRGEEPAAPPAATSAPPDFVPPGAAAFDAALSARIRAALSALDKDYEPRTRHRNPDGTAKFSNRLLLESSPYLLQHAHNPVNWYPWGEEAFAAAKRLGRPVLLSVGYSTCHWCHVMEEESFEDPEIAAYLNQNYIAIKVDREERPDIDSIYMTAVQAITRGGGGWPMTVWLTPERAPFFGGTYFPPRAGARGSQIGFQELLEQLKARFDSDPKTIAASAAQVVDLIQRLKEPPAGNSFSPADAVRIMDQAARRYQDSFDPEHGGLRGGPKFPSSLPVRFLLRYHRRSGDAAYLRMATLTLDKMAAGGIYDHAGGGFHRYATDERWLVPHFEKMLYDNALLAVVYLEAYQATGQQRFAAVARDILRYVQRDMTAPEGGFYSATDADSRNATGHVEEGAFFTWTPREIAAVLAEQPAALATSVFAVTPAGNFEGRTILSMPRPLGDVAAELNIAASRAQTMLADIKEALYQARAQRPPPLRDDKILTAWNGLMISALARAAVILGGPAQGPSYLQQAQRAAAFVLAKLRRDGRLLRSYRAGTAHLAGYLDDYAALVAALLDLFEASGDTRWLVEAMALDRVLHEHFEDRSSGGFFLVSAAHEKLLAREKPSHDGAVPSGNSMAALNLLRLYEFTTEYAYRDRAQALLQALAPVMLAEPRRLSELLLALDFWTDTAKEIVIVAPEHRHEAQPFVDVLAKTFVPNAVVTVVPAAATRGELSGLVPLVRNKLAQRGQVTAYVCEQQRCDLPTRDPALFGRQIRKIVPLHRQQQPSAPAPATP